MLRESAILCPLVQLFMLKSGPYETVSPMRDGTRNEAWDEQCTARGASVGWRVPPLTYQAWGVCWLARPTPHIPSVGH